MVVLSDLAVSVGRSPGFRFVERRGENVAVVSERGFSRDRRARLALADRFARRIGQRGNPLQQPLARSYLRFAHLLRCFVEPLELRLRKPESVFRGFNGAFVKPPGVAHVETLTVLPRDR